MTERVVVTGMGVVSPNGNGTQEFEQALRKGHSGLRRNEAMVEHGFGCHVAGVPEGVDALAEASFDEDVLLAMNDKLNRLIDSEVGKDDGSHLPDIDGVNWAFERFDP